MMKRLPLFLTAILLSATVHSQVRPDARNVLPRDGTPIVREHDFSWDYLPFLKGNRLTALRGKPTLTIASQYPRLDGATALWPVYAAAVQGIYRGLDYATVTNFVAGHKTPSAYQQLIDGEVDMIFAAQPSAGQIAAAKAKGLTLTLTPMAKEAFVFLVNKQNPVTSLSVPQIRAIYSGQVNNWKDIGGQDAAILAFQRPADSGSQSTLIAKVMQGTKLKAPLRQQNVAEGMGKMVNDVGTSVADYRNYPQAIGYSFRFYATEMVQNNNVRLLAINGIAPTVDNIRSNTYPFTVEVYMVTARARSANTQKLMDWFLSPQGQRLVEDAGYVGVK